MILEEEIEDMLESSGQCAGSIEQEHAVIGQIDNGILQLDEEVRQFLERIKQRKHALECERATHEEKIRLITHDKGNWENKLVGSWIPAHATGSRRLPPISRPPTHTVPLAVAVVL